MFVFFFSLTQAIVHHVKWNPNLTPKEIVEVTERITKMRSSGKWLSVRMLLSNGNIYIYI